MDLQQVADPRDPPGLRGARDRRAKDDAKCRHEMVADMARGSVGTVRLLHVARIPTERVSDDGRVVTYVNQEMERIEHSRLDYLKGAEAGLQGVPVESVVRFGDRPRGSCARPMPSMRISSP